MARVAVEGFLGLAARRCDSCKGSPAVLFCRADAAYLCSTCDSRVHGANRLASRHERVWMCEVCEQAPADVTCKADAATLCVTCDADIHAANLLARRHERLPVAPFSALRPSAATAAAFADEDDHDSSPAGATWMIPNSNPKAMEALDLNFFADVDPYLDIDYADRLVPVQGKPVAAVACGGAPPPLVVAPDGGVEVDFTKPSYSSYNASQSLRVSSSEVGVVPDGGGGDVTNSYGVPPAVAMDREARVMRYREKRKNRRFEKTIRYASRKAYAETRPRIKGRFVKRVEMDADVDGIYSAAAAIMVDNAYGVVPSF